MTSPTAGAAIAVVIPHLNQPELLGLCLAALARQTLDLRRVEVVVVDNGSDTLPEAVVAPYPWARLVAEAEPGPGPARNRGVALSHAPLIAFTDSDCVPDPGWLSALVARFEAEPEAGVLGGEVRVFPAQPGQPAPAEAYDMVYGFRQAHQIAKYRFAATANLAVRREVFEAVGPFAGITVSEDMDWGQRAARAGHPTRFAGDALVLHPARRSMGDLRRQWDRHIDHHHTMKTQRPFGQVRWLLEAVAIAVSPLAEIGTILRTDRLPDARGRVLAFAALVRMRAYRGSRMVGCMLPATKRRADKVWNRS